MIDHKSWQVTFRDWLALQELSDPAHDLHHVERVVANSLKLAAAEDANLAILLPAAWLHDCVHVPKNSPDRSKASELAADRGVAFLREKNYPAQFYDSIHHAIVAHSFSANIPPTTIEAKLLQDADRLDALGAIGLSRCLMLGGHMGKPLANLDDPFCEHRSPDDTLFVIDHLYAKLLKLADSMKTKAGRALANERTEFLQSYLRALKKEWPGS